MVDWIDNYAIKDYSSDNSRQISRIIRGTRNRGGRTKEGRVSVRQTGRDLTRIAKPWSTFDPVCNGQQTPVPG